MTTTKEKSLKIVAEKEASAKVEVSSFPTELPKPMNPILKMAIEQAEHARIKDIYHGFKE